MKISRQTKFFSMLVSIVIILTIAGFSSYKHFISANNQLKINPQKVVFDGKTDGFSSLKNMEELTRIIVRGKN
ncbi:hypothetical protein [Bacillus sp. AFS053548]|uniref:hypothetical protein n=1 Tax=Bacillus sp. AFS053548 TaxID=2033505 RepID=UPI000BFCBAE2|nr:hypothetical protein [Bacillus sp. AFS053548]PGM57784.1 hypothetical protein CN946_06465 [Bacillus sp. AFS053548]